MPDTKRFRCFFFETISEGLLIFSFDEILNNFIDFGIFNKWENFERFMMVFKRTIESQLGTYLKLNDDNFSIQIIFSSIYDDICKLILIKGNLTVWLINKNSLFHSLRV